MTKIIVVPGQNVFNRNYRGSTCYCRNNLVIVRQKRISKRNPLSTVSITRSFLKKSSSLWPTLNTAEKQTFIDYKVSNPKYKSGLNVMAGVNVATAYTNQLCFTLVRSLTPPAQPPVYPHVYISAYSETGKWIWVRCSNEYTPIVNIRIWIDVTMDWYIRTNEYFIYNCFFRSNIEYKQISVIPYLSYKVLWIKGTALDDNGLESELSPSNSCPIV